MAGSQSRKELKLHSIVCFPHFGMNLRLESMHQRRELPIKILVVGNYQEINSSKYVVKEEEQH